MKTDMTARRPVARLIAVLCACLITTGCSRAGGEAFQPTQNTAVALAEGHTVGQTVNPAGDRLRGIDLQVATYAASPDPEGVLQVDLVDPDTGDRLARTRVSGADLADLSWAGATFDPPVDVPDVILVETTWDGRTPIALWANVPLQPSTRSAPAADANNPYLDGQLVVDGVPQSGDLAFRVRGAGGAAAAADQLREVARSSASRMADQPFFSAVWLLALAGALTLVIRFRRDLRA